MKNIYTLCVVFLLSIAGSANAQDDMLSMFDQSDKPTTDYTYATFKTSRVVYGHSVENPAKGNLLFLVQHNFGALNSGAYELFGLDQATIRLGFEYGLNDKISIGIGRSTYEKTVDGFVKVRILRQSKGAVNMPVTISYYGSIAINGLHWQDPNRNNYFTSRLSFINQLLIARKFNNDFSLQLSPTLIHKNLVPTTSDKNTAFACGIGGRYKLTQRTSFNAEYFYYPDNLSSMNTTDVFSLGFDIETGGHVFQLHISNASAMFDRAFITETTGKWTKGDIYFGFSISRAFVVKKPKGFRN